MTYFFFIFIFFRPTDRNYFEKNPYPNKSIWFGLIYIKKEVFFLFCTVLFVVFLNSETSLNFSSLIGEILVRTQNFDS